MGPLRIRLPLTGLSWMSEAPSEPPDRSMFTVWVNELLFSIRVLKPMPPPLLCESVRDTVNDESQKMSFTCRQSPQL